MNEARLMYIDYCSHVIGLPAMAVTENTTGRATSTARATMSTQGTIEPRRQMLGALVAAQWGQPILEKNWPDVAKKWRVKVVFDKHDAESLAQRVEAANGVMASFPVTAKAYGELIGDANFEDKVDPERLKIVMEAEKNQGVNDRAAQGGKMAKGKSGSSKKQNVSKPDEQSKR